MTYLFYDLYSSLYLYHDLDFDYVSFYDPYLYHYDLYRIEADEEIDELGFDQALAEGITLIEWPERVPRLGGANRLDLIFQEGDSAAPGHRRVAMMAGAAWRPRLEGVFAVLGGAGDV